MPPDHPARDMQDTFYLKGRSDLLLRTHTSTGQIRYMLANPHPPRRAHHLPGEGLPARRRHHALADVPPGRGAGRGPRDHAGRPQGHHRGLPARPLRAAVPGALPRRRSFPYTEPSVEVDLGCVVCGGKGCRVCKGTGWLEILGSGMVASRRVRGGERAARPGGLRPRAGHRASPSASASSAWRWCGTASTTSACSTAATCASWSSSGADG